MADGRGFVVSRKYSRADYEASDRDSPSPYGLAQDYAFCAFALLDGSGCQLQLVEVLGGYPELGCVTVLLDCGSPMRDLAASAALTEAWPHSLFPVGVLVSVEPRTPAAAAIAGRLEQRQPSTPVTDR